ncbi:hypothetical protein F183_A29400 [Bryobacterales bacterium F-183]|nr:hypothetical protein F183_A29400 [Bryobacterales bacterium F-183]
MTPAPLYALLFINLTANLFMLGLIWFVQIVHYPLFAATGRDQFTRYESQHASLTTLVVGPPMLAELAASLALAAFATGGRLPAWALWSSVALVGIIWLSTAFLQVPCHDALQRGFDVGTHQFLVNSNWIRTIAWSLKAAISVYLCWKVIVP